MGRDLLYAMLLTTGVMAIMGVREMLHDNWALGCLFFLIPVAGWASIIFGT